MRNELESLINKIISENEILDEESLSVFLSNGEEMIVEIEQAASGNDWVHFSESTYDGWYCVEQNTNIFDVFYKERGAVAWGTMSHKTKAKAVASVLAQSGYATF